jgi:nucleoside 2-deoxyribosyltransferase
VKGTVYLAGPITGLSYGGATDWREYARKALAEDYIEGISPMRAKHYLARLSEISGHGRDYHNMNVISQQHSVVTRDRFDTQRVDVVLMNLLGAKAVSIGSMVELGWADAARVPVVLVREEPGTGGAHDHMFVHELGGFGVATLEEGLDVVRAILS